ncbi:MAG: transcriptional repressor [Candidatus Binataceae bacterium]|jgi:Fur family peroxide stress response transcriptional regulator
MAEFTERCRAGGLAITPQRLAIIEALLASTDHPRAERIFDEVRRRHPHISLATVHRTLETLCSIGEARKVTLLHDSARYDGNLDPHHHVICVKCRTIRDVAIAGFELAGGTFSAEGHPALAGFTPLGWSLEVQALCDRCNKGTAGRRDEKRGRKVVRKARTAH